MRSDALYRLVAQFNIPAWPQSSIMNLSLPLLCYYFAITTLCYGMSNSPSIHNYRQDIHTIIYCLSMSYFDTVLTNQRSCLEIVIRAISHISCHQELTCLPNISNPHVNVREFFDRRSASWREATSVSTRKTHPRYLSVLHVQSTYKIHNMARGLFWRGFLLSLLRINETAFLRSVLYVS